MHSALYLGWVMHRRVGPLRHGFRYRIYMHLLDLDELRDVDTRLHLFGYNRVRPVSFRDADHLGDPVRSVRDNLKAFLLEQSVEPPDGPIRLLTHCRVFGYVFNPVSFVFCYDRPGALRAIVAEVHNTFGERHCYLLRDADRNAAADRGGRVSDADVWFDKKVFHVSPFMALDGTYRFTLGEPTDRFQARIDLYRQSTLAFASRLTLTRVPLNDWTLGRMLVSYPLMTLRVIGGIHWEAFRLWLKGATYYRKPPYDPEAARGGSA